jgi:hypothetical protein
MDFSRFDNKTELKPFYNCITELRSQLEATKNDSIYKMYWDELKQLHDRADAISSLFRSASEAVYIIETIDQIQYRLKFYISTWFDSSTINYELHRFNKKGQLLKTYLPTNVLKDKEFKIIKRIA